MASFLALASRILAIRSARLSLLAALSAAMLASLAWQAIDFFRDLNEQPALSSSAPSAPTNASAESNKPSSTVLGLFGTRGSEGNLDAQAIEKLPESNLNLQVSAIFFMAQAAQSSVILEDGDRTMILKPGDEARPGIIVQGIESHRITLKRNGKLEQISFKGFGEMPAGNSLGSPLPTAQQVDITAVTNQNNVNEVIAQVPADNPPMPSTAVDQNLPTAYQQYIQRKLAQNK